MCQLSSGIPYQPLLGETNQITLLFFLIINSFHDFNICHSIYYHYLDIFPLLYVLSPQCCDLGYHASLARTFRTYLSAEYNLETSRHEGLDIIENAVDNLDSRNDKHKIMDMHNQVFCPPMRFEYLPHMGDEVRCFKCCRLCKICLALHFEEYVLTYMLLHLTSSSGVPGKRPAACPD